MIDYFDTNEFITLLKSLALTRGPSLFEGPRREVLEKFLNENGVKTEVDAAGNLWVGFGGGPWAETVIFDAHIDVVQKGYAAEVRTDGDRLSGMGVADDLTAVTMLAFLAKMIAGQQPVLKRPLKILFSVGEEGDGNLKGVRQAVKDYSKPPYLFISFDLSFNEYSVSALGSKRYLLTVEGPGGHSWGDYGSPNAIDIIHGFFSEIKEAFKKIESENRGDVSFNIGSIKGGEGINSIAKFSEATFEFRGVDFQLLEQLDQVARKAAENFNNREELTVYLSLSSERPASKPVSPERIEPLVTKLLSSVCENPVSVPRSTNINIPLASGWPSICIGLCRSGRYHSEEEYVEIDSLKEGWILLCELFNELII